MKKEKTATIVIIILLCSTLGLTVTYSAYNYIINNNLKNTLNEVNLGHYLYFNIKPTVTIYNRSQVFENYTIFNIIPNTFIFVIYMLGQIAAIDIDGNIVFRTYGFGYRGNIRIIGKYTFFYELIGSLKKYDTRKGNVFTTGSPLNNPVTHDFVLLPNGNVLKVMHDVRKFGNRYYDGNKIVEMNMTTKENIWEWNVWDFFNLTNNCSICMHSRSVIGYMDWIHMNSLAYNESEDTIITNLRNLDTIVKINHTIPGNDPNAIIWELGGINSDFSGTGINFSHAHGCEIINGTSNQIITFDNGLHRDWGTEPFSRVLIIEINETSMTAEIVWNYNETPHFYSSHWAYAEKLQNNNILITDGVNGRVIEVNYTTHNIVWKMQLPPGFGIYRAFRIQIPFDFGKLNQIGPIPTILTYNLEIPYINNVEIFLIVASSVSIITLIYVYKKLFEN